MSCLPNLTIGDFTDRTWTSLSHQSDDNSIIITQSVRSIDISRSNNPNDRITLIKSQGLEFKSINFGERFVLIFEYYRINNQMMRQKVYLINTTNGQALTKLKLIDTGPSKTIYYPNPPFVGVSLGNNVVFHMYVQDHLQKAKGVAFYRSDNGLAICPIGRQAEVQLTGGLRIRAKYDGAQLKMFTNSQQQVLPTPCSLPLGKSKVTQSSPFPDAIVGAGVLPTLQTSTTSFLIFNIGANCLKINGISNTQHFSVLSPISFPIKLAHNGAINVVVKFNPFGLVGTYSENLQINFIGSVEVGSQAIIACNAKAKYPSNEALTPANKHTE